MAYWAEELTFEKSKDKNKNKKKLTNVEGTVVALYTPDYMGDLNAAGWHFHFITNDKTEG